MVLAYASDSFTHIQTVLKDTEASIDIRTGTYRQLKGVTDNDAPCQQFVETQFNLDPILVPFQLVTAIDLPRRYYNEHVQDGWIMRPLRLTLSIDNVTHAVYVLKDKDEQILLKLPYPGAWSISIYSELNTYTPIFYLKDIQHYIQTIGIGLWGGPDELPVLKSSWNTAFNTDMKTNSIHDYQPTDQENAVEIADKDKKCNSTKRKSRIKTKCSNKKNKQYIEPTCVACRDTGTAYWTDGVYGACMECNAGNVDSVPIVDDIPD